MNLNNINLLQDLLSTQRELVEVKVAEKEVLQQKGHKGQKARAGYSQKIGFEGGQMPLQRRLPKLDSKRKQKRV